MAIAAIGFSAADTITAIGAAASVGTSIASAEVSSRAASSQARAATQVAAYNAQIDQTQAQQIGLDANANIEKERADDASYLSSERAAYAADGVLSGTGSPLALQATTAGRQEEDIQNYWASTQEQETSLYDQASLGIAEGAEEADTYHLEGAGDIINGIGGVANTVGRFSQSDAGQQLFDNN